MQVHFYVEQVQIGRVHITRVAHVQEPRLMYKQAVGWPSCGNQHRLCYHYIIESYINTTHTSQLCANYLYSPTGVLVSLAGTCTVCT